MKPAPIPVDEAARLAALQAYDILDTLPEQVYDDLTHMASRLFDVPIALVSLVDDERQWFKSRVGLDATETPRDISFCGHAVAAKATLVVDDATKDARFADNPLVVGGPSVRFYAGAPLMTPNGHALGTLCIIDQRPRTLSEDERQTLAALSRLVVSQLELRRGNAELVVANAEAEQARHVAEDADRAKTRFLATMSHELRTPLNGIIGFGNLLRKNKSGLLGPRDVGYADRVVANGNHLLKLINDVLDLSKIEAGRLTIELEPISPSTIVEDVISLLGAEAQERDVRLVGQLNAPADHISADPHRLKQVLLNLVANALRFAEGGRVEVRVITDDSGRSLRIDIIDSGVGIAPDRLDAIFERFVQAESGTARTFGGTGLGLPIARALCAAMEMRLVADSRIGAGSTFSVLFADDVEAPVHEALEIPAEKRNTA